MMKPEKFMRSDCGQFLYGYADEWDSSLPTVGFVMLTTPAFGDQSVNRCIAKARQLGGGGISVVYLLPQLNLNNHGYCQHRVEGLLVDQLEECVPVIACWGKAGAHAERVAWYLEQVKEAGFTMTLHVLGFDKDGEPLAISTKHHKTVPTVWRLEG